MVFINICLIFIIILIYLVLIKSNKENFKNIYYDIENYKTLNIKRSLICRLRHIPNNYLYKRILIPNNKREVLVLVQDFKFFIDNHLNDIKHKIILIIIDHPFKSCCLSVNNYKNFLNNKHINNVYSENWNGEKHYKLKQIPIGFESKSIINDNEKNMMKIAYSQKSLKDKPLKILCNTHFLIHKNPKSGSYNQRQEVIDKLKNNNLVDFWKNKKSKNDTWKEHDNYSFELCPEGNGLDTHRFYEAIYLNTIPIVKKNKLEPIYKQFPCVIVDDFNEITEENCIKWKSQLENRIEKEKYKLNIDYWINNTTKTKIIKKKSLNTEIMIPYDISVINKEHLEDFVSRFYDHEVETNTRLKELINDINNQYILDAGAHIGDTGLFMAKHLKDIKKDNVKILMVEPDKSKVDFINYLIKLNSLENYAEVYNYALGKSYSKGKIIKKGHSGMWRIEKCYDNKCDIEINSIDNLFLDKNIGLMHLDVEGFEHETLQGSVNILKKYKPKIIIEVIHSDKEKIHDFLSVYNYKFKKKLKLDYLYE